jgi:hypothetical protein
MQITKLTNYHRYKDGRYINRVRRKVLYDTDSPKNRSKGIVERIEDAKEALRLLEECTDRRLSRLIDLIT